MRNTLLFVVGVFITGLSSFFVEVKCVVGGGSTCDFLFPPDSSFSLLALILLLGLVAYILFRLFRKKEKTFAYGLLLGMIPVLVSLLWILALMLLFPGGFA